MKIAVIGAGFTGLSASLELVWRGQDVTLFEASECVGGLAVGYKKNNWQWMAERFYHHIFTNDHAIIDLSRRVGLPPVFFRPTTAMYWEGKTYPFDSPLALFEFPGLSSFAKVRMALVLTLLKIIPNGRFLERWKAERSLRLLMGRNGFDTIWEPLLVGKFGREANGVNLAWFWARVKKRTARLGTFPGGFGALADRLASEIRRYGGNIKLHEKVSIPSLAHQYDVVLSTVPEKGGNVRYLDAHVLLLELKRPFLDNTYWLNILDRSFPFLVLAEHTNFVSSKDFNGSHLLYIGNYLSQNDGLFALSSNEVVKKFLPWLQKINPAFREKDIQDAHVFHGPFAQPVATVNYSRTIPPIKRTKKLYVANQSMIYPWDRGTNYAVELGQRAAREILKNG